MSSKNYVKAHKRAKLKRNFYFGLIVFIPVAITLFIFNVTFVFPNIPWSLFPIMAGIFYLGMIRLFLFKQPQKTIFSRDYLQYTTEKEKRILEFEDDMDEMEAEKLDLYPTEKLRLMNDGISESDLV